METLPSACTPFMRRFGGAGFVGVAGALAGARLLSAMRGDLTSTDGNTAGAERSELSLTSPDSEALSAMTGAESKPLSAKQTASVVKRLRVILGEAMEEGKRLGVELTPPKLAAICDELLHEARNAGYQPDFGSSVEGFFLRGVFDQLVQEPSNIFDQVQALDGREYYVPLTPEQWVACLSTLRLSLLPQG